MVEECGRDESSEGSCRGGGGLSDGGNGGGGVSDGGVGGGSEDG